MSDFLSSMPVRTMSHHPLEVTVTPESVLSNTRSFNNRLVVEAYQKEGLKSTVSSGFAFIQQKVSVKGLQVLMDSKLADGTIVLKGSTAYIKEESLHTAPWAQKILESEFLGSPFIIVDMSNVEFISPPNPEAA